MDGNNCYYYECLVIGTNGHRVESVYLTGRTPRAAQRRLAEYILKMVKLPQAKFIEIENGEGLIEKVDLRFWRAPSHIVTPYLHDTV